MREERKDESEAVGSLISTGREATDAVNLAPAVVSSGCSGCSGCSARERAVDGLSA